MPRNVDELRAVLQRAQRAATPVSIAGGRHAMGGQQFGEGTVLIDTRGLDRVLAFDPAAGLVTVEGGIQWPALLEHLERIQAGAPRPWSIYQKQTGADRLSLGGALSCNAHGRGLTLPPIVQQVEAFDLVDGHGQVLTCSRTEHADLFRLAIGGYGLFGVIARITLRLRPRVKVRRVVTIGEASQVIDRFDALIRDGFLYGDFQFAIDTDSDTFLRQGVLSCYEPVPADTPLTEHPAGFSSDDWTRLTWLAHRDKQEAFALYARRYLETSGQIYWGDEQLAAYVDDYHAALDRTLGAPVKGTEMITGAVRAPAAPGRLPGRRARRAPAAPRQRHLRHGAAHRARRRDLSRVGARALGVRDLQSARGPHARRHRGLGGRLPRAHRRRHRPRAAVTT